MIYLETLELGLLVALNCAQWLELQKLRSLLSRSPQHLKYGKVYHRNLAPLDTVNDFKDPSPPDAQLS
jgi:hypothetical protein